MEITLFGNDTYEPDGIAVKVKPYLEKIFPKVTFTLADPTENLAIPSKQWVIIDAGMGIEKVTYIQRLEDLEGIRGESVHDYDVYMELKLRQKVAQLPPLALLLIPIDYEISQATKELAAFIKKLI